MNDTQPPRDHQPPDDVDPRTYALIRTQAFNEAAHALELCADAVAVTDGEHKARVWMQAADLVRGLIDDGEAGDSEPRQGKPGPNPLRTVFTGSHG